MALEEILPQWTWIFTVVSSAALTLVVAMCVCSKSKEKTQAYGTAGRLSITRDSPIIQLRPSNGNAIPVQSPELDTPVEDGIKRNSWTVKDRALPDIPESKTVGVGNSNNNSTDKVDRSELNVAREQNKKKSSKSAAPKPPLQETSINLSSCDVLPEASGDAPSKDPPHVTVTITVNDKPRSLNNSTSLHKPGFSSSPLSMLDSLPGTSSNTVILKKIEKVETRSEVVPVFSNSREHEYNAVPDTFVDPHSSDVTPSPVCIRIGAPPNVNEAASIGTPAGLAVAGAVPSSDIPYMTPPLLHNPSVSSALEETDEASGTSGTRSEVPYTVISVREPLAKVRAQTIRKQRNAMQHSSEEGEDHYALVPEEEQMYAEIGSGHESGSSSITYAHIEPRELPPVPPTVESLKSVAHAHSRQASTVSSSSFASCMSSSGEPTSPPQLRNPTTSLYSTVEKNSKQRKTIHIAEGASLMSTVEKRKKVEDLYAKVRKKRAELTVNISGGEDYSLYQGVEDEDQSCSTPPPSPWASTTPPAPPPLTGRLQVASLCTLTCGSGGAISRRHSAEPHLPECSGEVGMMESEGHISFPTPCKSSDEPGYERIYNEQDDPIDSCYEKIKESEIDQIIISEPGYECVQATNSVLNDLNYPGYESVHDEEEDEYSSDPGYECVAQLSSESDSADPGYEPVRISANLEDCTPNYNSSSVKSDDEREPGYETVKRVHRTESDSADPGYEKIRKVLRAESDATEPGYERVRNKLDDIADPGYETVHRSDSDAEPTYEIVRHRKQSEPGAVAAKNSYSSINYSTGDNVTYQASSSCTVLVLSGQPVSQSGTAEENTDEMVNSGDNERHATFL